MSGENDNRGSDPWDYYFSHAVKIIAIYGVNAGRDTPLENCYLSIEDRQLYITKETFQILLSTCHIGNGRIGICRAVDTKCTKYTLLYEATCAIKGNGYLITFNEIIIGGFIDRYLAYYETTDFQFNAMYPLELEIQDKIENVDINYEDGITIQVINNGQCGTYTCVCIDISSEKPKTLSTLTMQVLELLYLFIGQTPIEGVFSANIGGETLISHQSLLDKYQFNVREAEHTIIQKINNDTFTIQLLNDFLATRKQTGTLFDGLMYASNAKLYADDASVQLINILQGTAINFDERDKKEKRLHCILDDYIGNGKNGNEYIKKVFSYEDNKSVELIDKLCNFRNYYSHYGYGYMGPNITREYSFLRNKLELLIRLMFFKKLGIEVDEALFNDTIASLNESEQKLNIDLTKIWGNTQ